VVSDTNKLKKKAENYIKTGVISGTDELDLLIAELI